MQESSTRVNLNEVFYSLLPKSYQTTDEIRRTMALWRAVSPEQVDYGVLSEHLEHLVETGLAECKKYIGIHSMPVTSYRFSEHGCEREQQWMRRKRPQYFDDDNYTGVNFLRKT